MCAGGNYESTEDVNRYRLGSNAENNGRYCCEKRHHPPHNPRRRLPQYRRRAKNENDDRHKRISSRPALTNDAVSMRSAVLGGAVVASDDLFVLTRQMECQRRTRGLSGARAKPVVTAAFWGRSVAHNSASSSHSDLKLQFLDAPTISR